MQKKNIFIVFLVLLLTLLNPACKTIPDTSSDAPALSVSILPQKYFVSKIAGEKYPVNVLIPPGASPAVFEPSPDQMHMLQNSAAYFRIGKIAYEKVLSKNLKSNFPDIPVFDLSDGISFISQESRHGDHIHTGDDPHIWLSALNAMIISRNVYKNLKQLFPEDSLLFSHNYQLLNREIQRIDSLYQANSGKLKDKHFLIYHPALGYLAKDYGMIQHVLEYEGKEPPPSYIAEIIQKTGKHNIRRIFIQHQFPVDNATSLAREINAEVIRIDPLNEEWDKEMENILTSLIKD